MSNQEKSSPKKENKFLKEIKGKNFLLIVGVALLSLLFLLWTKNYLKYTIITYSEFKALVKDRLVDNLVITSQDIKGEFKKGALEKLAELRKGKINVKRIHRYFRVNIPQNDPQLFPLLDKYGIHYTIKPHNKKLENFLSWFIPLVILIGVWIFIFKKFISTEGGIFGFGKSKAKVYVEDEIKTTFKDVAGVDEAVEELKEIIDFLKNPDRFTRIGAKIPKGVLLVGPPGTGKTLLARAVAGEAKVPFISISGSSFVEMFVGVGAARVRDLFAQAEEKAPCIIFIDEIDAIGRVRGVSPAGGSEEREHTLTQLLTEMDGFDPKKGVIIIAATNRPEILDPALLRPGRFDRVVVVDRPDLKGREAILRLHAKNLKIAPDVDFKIIAARTPGMVGADLANIVNEAALLAARKNKEYIEMEDFEEAIDRVIAGLAKKNKYLSQEEKRRIAYHEAGHALVAAVVHPDEKVHRISIIPRGIAALGYTLQLPTEEKYLFTKRELLNKITVLLGGRVAEELVFKEVSTGAQNDLEKATEIARAMVMDYGMSANLGPQTFRKREFLFLDVPFKERELVSEETARKIDEEISRILRECYLRAREVLQKHRDLLDKIAELLLKKEVLEGEELENLFYKNKDLKNEKGEEKNG